MESSLFTQILVQRLASHSIAISASLVNWNHHQLEQSHKVGNWSIVQKRTERHQSIQQKFHMELTKMMTHVPADKGNGDFMDNWATQGRMMMAIVHLAPNRPFIPETKSAFNSNHG